MLIQPARLHVDDPSNLNRFYRSLETPELARYAVRLDQEAPKIAGQLQALPPEQQEQFWQIFGNQLAAVDASVTPSVSGDPTVRHMATGAALGGVAGLGGAGVALSLTQLSRTFTNPVLFAIGVTALGVVAGAVSGNLAQRLSAPPSGSQQHLKVDYGAPGWARVILGEFNVEIQASSTGEPSAGAQLGT